MNKEQTTKKQHYVPRFILRKHACETHKNNLIYQYDKQSKSERIVPIKSVSFAKSLYEFHDEKGLNEKTKNNIEKMASTMGIRMGQDNKGYRKS